jgi:hypothetical protein
MSYVGDWLRSVDGHEVTFQNIDSVLTNLTTPSKVSFFFFRYVVWHC